MFIRYQTKAILIKMTPRGEGDVIVTLFSQDFGKFSVRARSLRKIKSKLRSASELFSLVSLRYVQGRYYKTLIDLEEIDNYPSLKSSPAKLKTAFQISRTLDSLVHQQEQDRDIWELLLTSFQQLADMPEESDDYFDFSNKHLIRRYWSLKLVYHYFFWHLINILGYQPELYDCALCRKKLRPTKLYFSFREGGVLCPACFQRLKEEEQKDCLEIEPGLIKIVRLLVKQQWPLLKKLKIDMKEKIALENLLNNFSRSG